MRKFTKWLDDVKEWIRLSSNEMWREPEDCVAWRKLVSRVAPNGLDSLRESRLKKFQDCTCMSLSSAEAEAM